MGRLRVLTVGVAASALSALCGGALSGAAAAEVHVASCERGPVMIGSGSAGWRRESVSAGPVGLRRPPLGQMSRYSKRRPNEFVTKAPVLVEGHQRVTLSVPPRLAHRVFLYYGADPRGSTFWDYPGHSSVELSPCADKPRTIWPGGLRVKGRAPVYLLVSVEGGSAEPLRLPLGRPKLFRPPR